MQINLTKLLWVPVVMLVSAGAADAAGALITSSKQIRNGVVSSADLDKRTRAKLARAGRPGPTGPTGAAGTAGPAGVKGEPGPRGEAGDGLVADGSRVDGGAADIELKAGGEFRTILSMKITTPGSGLLLGSGAVEVSAADGEQGTAVVSLRVLHNGHPHLIPSATDVAAGAQEALHVSFHCNLLPGAQDVQLQARVTGAPLTVGARTADIVSATQGQ